MAKESWNVLRLDKELLVFPMVSGFCCLLVLASFGLPLWNSPYASVLTGDREVLRDPVAWLILFAFYAVNYFVIVFFNSALVACALIRFRGGDPTVGDGFRASMQRLPQILAWALVSATVGVLLRAIESRSEKAGQFAAALLGAGWTIATYFVVPVLVVEQAGPIQAVQRSFEILRKTWGEAVGAHFSLKFFVFLASLVAILPIVGGGFALAGGQTALGVALLVCGVLGLMLVSLISTTLDTIILAALYLYAADGAVPAHFDDRLLQHAFAGRG
ncbi:MAG: hypothetical protein JNG89_17180 [Planctomycetaceae bacterium]|nr:hypothetical protein [Planctomycetaceae bacterium]